ncbi:MAG: hypothetical protein OEO20_11385 [Gemmatimonadota bacterium]|nr:hypothetical protein [Gemmatimonadota bacterium]MDH3366507.1 hypothetical protein [Gemmatimonadota bacterium]MDH3478896.1 hypothetical protein [Gemmatimonadota bacterium]
MTIIRYHLVDSDDRVDDYPYDSYQEAYETARRRNMAVLAYVYEFADSELIWTPNGADTWPPEKQRRPCPR